MDQYWDIGANTLIDLDQYEQAIDEDRNGWMMVMETIRSKPATVCDENDSTFNGESREEEGEKGRKEREREREYGPLPRMTRRL